MPRRGRFTPGNDPVPIVQDAVAWTDAEHLAQTGIRSPDRPARRELLYRLSYPGARLQIGMY
jgi:hypothetical protein